VLAAHRTNVFQTETIRCDTHRYTVSPSAVLGLSVSKKSEHEWQEKLRFWHGQERICLATPFQLQRSYGVECQYDKLEGMWEEAAIYFKVTVKVKLSLCLTKHHDMQVYWGAEVYLHAFLTSALDGGEWSSSRPGRFIPRERARGTH
jgi:hypothetical protein